MKYWLPPVLLVVFGALSLAGQWYVFPADERPRDWRAAAKHVVEHAEGDDAIRVHPNWTEEPLPYLDGLGDQLSRQDHPLAEDLQDNDAVWVITETDRKTEAVDLLPFEPTSPQTHDFGTVTVIRAAVPDSVKYGYELLEHLDEATVERILPNKDNKHCEQWDPEERRWDCGQRNPWLFVGQRTLFLNDDPHQCIWAHPLGGDKILRITFPDVPLGDTLRLRAGLNFRARISQRGTDVHLKVKIDGKQALDHTFDANESTWFPLDIDTADKAGGRHDVALEVTSPKLTDRYFCLNGWAL